MIHVDARTVEGETLAFLAERWGLRVVARPKPRPQAWILEWAGEGSAAEAAFDDRQVAEAFYDRFVAAADKSPDLQVEVVGVLGEDGRTITAVLRSDPSVEDLEAMPFVGFAVSCAGVDRPSR